MTMVISGDGTITGLTAGGLPDATVTQSDLAANVAGNGPAFSAYVSGTPTISNNSWTKVALDSEDFDTSSRFNATASTVGGIPAYSFMPTVAGYYQLNAKAQLQLFTSIGLGIYKNDTAVGYAVGTGTSGQLYSAVLMSKLVYLNGTTDYVSMSVYQASGGSATMLGGENMFNGTLVRAA